jgi:hypothetical protein
MDNNNKKMLKRDSDLWVWQCKSHLVKCFLLSCFHLMCIGIMEILHIWDFMKSLVYFSIIFFK